VSTKRIIDLEDSSQLDLNDYLALYNSEPTADVYTYKRKVSDVLALKTITVNGKTGNTITLNADDISDTITAHKFVTAAEKAKIGIVRNDLGGNAYLAGDGTYKTITNTYSGETTILIVSGNTSISNTGNFLVICNTGSNALNIDLPASPLNKQAVRFKDSGNGLAHNVTVNGNGKLIEGDSFAVINSNYGAFEVMFISSINKWLVSSFV